MTFLCPVHRDWVHFHPQEALLYSQEAQQQGELLAADKAHREAIPFLGCALETTDILFNLHPESRHFLVKRYTALAILLAGSFYQLKEAEIGHDVLANAETRLREAAQKLKGDKTKLVHIQRCILELCTTQAHLDGNLPWGYYVATPHYQ